VRTSERGFFKVEIFIISFKNFSSIATKASVDRFVGQDRIVAGRRSANFSAFPETVFVSVADPAGREVLQARVARFPRVADLKTKLIENKFKTESSFKQIENELTNN
jgi:hypothetical protein